MQNSKIVGLVCARAGSKRLPNKNSLEILGEPLYYRACKTLSEEIRWVYLLTNIQDTIWYNTVQRPEELNGDDVPLQDVVKWFLNGTEYEQCVVLMPTNPMITSGDIREAIHLLDKGRKVVRSYDVNGNENGLYALDVDYFLNNNYSYDVDTGAMQAYGTEIHYQHEYDNVKRFLENHHA
jgi:hypothetical protein